MKKFFYIIIGDETGLASRELETMESTTSETVWDIANKKYADFEYYDVYGWFETEETMNAWKAEVGILPKK